jgi:hypothetical protein
MCATPLELAPIEVIPPENPTDADTDTDSQLPLPLA